MADHEENIALSVRNVSKTFKLPHERHSGLKQSLISKIGGRHQRGYELQHVLKDISFDVKKGEFFGIVGRNGSGKSTLLKLISNIYTPDSGAVKINGSLTPFIELGVGFNHELSGRENVYMNGALMGFSRQEMDAKYDDIVEFAELEDFMDQKLKNYSSGMQVRLAFAIAIQSDSDILILDEVLAVGDEAFQRKCNDYFMNVKEDPTKTVILVTHSMDAVKKYCDRAVVLKDGKLLMNGSPEQAANVYSLENLEQKMKRSTPESSKKDSEIKNLRVQLLSKQQINQDESVTVQVTYTTANNMPTKAAVSLYDLGRKAPILGSVSPMVDGREVKLTFSVKVSELNDTNFSIRTTIRNEDGEILDFVPMDECPNFLLRRTDYGEKKSTYSLLRGKGEWQ